MSQTIENLPTGWAWVKLGEIGEITSGGTPSTKDPQNFGGEISWITPADLSGYSEKYISRGKTNLSQKGLATSSAKLIPAGSVIFSSRAPVGYVAIAQNDLCTNQGFKNITSNLVSPDFIFHYLKFAKRLIESFGSGTTFLEVSASKFSQVPFPLPPHPEQIRIVQKLESLLARLARAEQALAAAETGLARFRQSVLKAAFRAEDADGKLKEGWRRVKLGEVCELITKGSSPSWQGIQYVDREELLFVTSENVRENFLDLSSPKYLEFGFNEKQRRSILKKGDVLLNIVGASIGRAAIFDLEKLANINQAVCVIRPKPELSNHFLSFFLNSATAKTYYDTSKVDVARANLSLKDVNELGFSLPDLPTQAQIVQKIEHALTRARALETAVQTARAECARLRQSILREAFAGRLVPQDPADEPAETLLARLRAGTGKAAKPLKIRQKK